MSKIGFYIIIIAILFSIAETIYFGNNLVAKSNEEKIADWVSLILSCIGMFLYLVGKNKNKIN